MATIPEVVLTQIRTEWKAARNGGKSLVVSRWASVLECSPQTIYRMLDSGRKRKTGECKLPGLRDAAMTIARIKRRPPTDAGEISTDQAIRLALDNHAIPDSMAAVSVATFNRVIRDMGLTQRVRRVQRFQADRPNQLHHVDASSSQYFYVHRQAGDDYVLKLHSPTGKHYKNKPVPIRIRPWLYGLTDDHSGYHVARYTVAPGESLADNLQFLAWAWGANDDKPFFGLPDRLKADQGPLMKGEASREWLDRLGINAEPSRPYEKDSHGKIERPWRTLWARFERVFFVEADWRKFEITLCELNRRFRIYQEEYNDRPHRYEKGVSRLDMWRRISLHGGAVAMPENAIATAVRRYPRTVGADGCFSLGGPIYEVKGLHAAQVLVYEGIFDDRLVVEDIRTGEKYEVETFAPTALDEFRAHRETPHQVAAKEAQTLELRNTLYMDRKEEAGGGKVRQLPTMIKERRQIADPLNVNAFESVEAAMREFMSISPMRLDPEARKSLQDLMIENRLSRRYVRELALEIQAESARTDVG